MYRRSTVGYRYCLVAVEFRCLSVVQSFCCCCLSAVLSFYVRRLSVVLNFYVRRLSVVLSFHRMSVW